jgi:hypothetical protein
MQGGGSGSTLVAMTDRVLIAGGGVAALEGLIALRELAGDRLHLTLLAPEPDFVYRPLAVAEPFCLGHAAHHRLAAIAADFGAELIRDSVAEAAPGAVTTGYGDTLPYDSLIADLEPEPFRPVLRGMLLTGGNNRWLRGPAPDTATASKASERALWWPPTKIATPYLEPYLMGRDEAKRLAARPAHAQPVERDLEPLVPR